MTASGEGTFAADETEVSGDGSVAADETEAAEEISVEKRNAAAKAAIGKIGLTIREAAAEKPEVIIVY